MDLINSSFIFAASFFYLLNIKEVLSDKEVKGTNFWSMVFFCAWNVWTAFFYIFATSFFWTQIAAVLCGVVNTIYLQMVIKLRNRNK